MTLEAQIASVQAELGRVKAELKYAQTMGEKGRRIARLMSDEKALEAYLLDLNQSLVAMKVKIQGILSAYEGKYYEAFTMRYLQRGNDTEEISRKTGIPVDELNRVFARMEKEDLVTPWVAPRKRGKL